MRFLSLGSLRLYLVSFATVSLIGCSSIYYSVWEKLGKEKRDLLRDNVEAVQSDQTQVTKQFENTLERLKDSYGTGGGTVEDRYYAIKSDYEELQARTAKLDTRIKKVEEIGHDLFREWKNETEEIQSADLRRRSEEKRETTQQRFEDLREQMHKAYESTKPVLARLNDQMLFLKHSLNSQAIVHLEQSEIGEIEKAINQVTKDLHQSIARADEFIGELN